MPKALITILLLIVSNIFMTFAWYGNLKLTELKINTNWPLILIILTSWGVAFFEYSFMIPANRIGSQINGGPFSLMQLKILAECISLTVFTVIVATVFKGEPIRWNHLVSFGCIVLAVVFAFWKRFICCCCRCCWQPAPQSRSAWNSPTGSSSTMGSGILPPYRDSSIPT